MTILFREAPAYALYPNGVNQGGTFTIASIGQPGDRVLMWAEFGDRFDGSNGPVTITAPDWEQVDASTFTGWRYALFTHVVGDNEPAQHTFTVTEGDANVGDWVFFRVAFYDDALSKPPAVAASSLETYSTLSDTVPAPSITMPRAGLLVGFWGREGNSGFPSVAAGMTERTRYNLDGSSWRGVADQAVGAGATGDKLATNTGYVKTRVGGLVGLVPGNAPPTAPTLLSPVGGKQLDRTKPIILSARFNDPDPGDSPAASHWRYRLLGGVWTTVDQPNPLQTYTIPAGIPAGDYEWQAAYQDSQGEPTNPANLVWAASEFFTAVDPPPGTTLVDPLDGQTISTSSYTGELSTPELDESEWTLYADNNGAIDTTQIVQGPVVVTTGDLRHHTFTGLVNNVPVWWSARHKLNGLYSQPDTARTPVSYTEPAAAVVTLMEDPAWAQIVVGITNPPPAAGEPDAAYNNVWVTDPGKPAQRRATMIPPNGSWTYRTPPSGFDGITVGLVQVETVATNGTSSWSELPAPGAVYERLEGGTPTLTGDETLSGGPI